MFPVNDVDEVYMLDLCTLAYQLHSQALVFTFDPYYEQMKLDYENKEKDPDSFPLQINWLKYRRGYLKSLRKLIRDSNDPADLQKLGLRGPEELMRNGGTGWDGNDRLDPILYDWDQINPARPSMTRQAREEEGVVLYAAPNDITERIKSLRTVTYDTTHSPYRVTEGARGGNHGTMPDPANATVSLSAEKKINGKGTDRIYVFEGATGLDKQGRGIWSPMGFVLVQEHGNEFDVFIVFRGSRSGELRARQSWKSKGACDWDTDLDVKKHKYPGINQYGGEAHHGFARCLLSMTPTISEALNHVSTEYVGCPRNIFVSGHSLGGALAHLLIGSLLTGNDTPWSQLKHQAYQNRKGKAPMEWPWTAARVALFAAPPVGNGDLRKSFYKSNKNTKNYFLNMDIVAASRLQHKRYKLFHSHHMTGKAHSPDYIRPRLQDHYRDTGNKYPLLIPADDLKPFNSYKIPSKAFEAIHDKSPTLKDGKKHDIPKNALRNLKIYIHTLSVAVKDGEVGLAERSSANADILDRTIATLDKCIQRQTGKRDLEKVFEDLGKLSFTEPLTQRAVGLRRMIQAWLWLGWVESNNEWDKLDDFVDDDGLPKDPWIRERGDKV